MFGSVTVPYNIDASASSDLSHSPGTLVFTEGEREKVHTQSCDDSMILASLPLPLPLPLTHPLGHYSNCPG